MNTIEEIYEQRIRDINGNILFRSRVACNDKKNFQASIKSVCDKYGYRVIFPIEEKEQSNILKEKFKKQREEELKKVREYFNS